MKGEFFAMPPKPKQAPKKAFKKVMIDSKTLADMLPQDDLSHATAIDAFGFGLSVKRDPDEETDQMWVDFCDRGELGWGVFGGASPSSSSPSSSPSSSSSSSFYQQEWPNLGSRIIIITTNDVTWTDEGRAEQPSSDHHEKDQGRGQGRGW